jgi:hypothetical protein
MLNIKQDYVKDFKKLPKEFAKIIIKTGILLGLFAYWGVIVMGTFLQFN